MTAYVYCRNTTKSAVSDVESRLSRLSFVRGLQSPYEPKNGDQISSDGHSALIEFEIPSTNRIDPQEKVDRSLAAVAAAQRAHPELRIDVLFCRTVLAGTRSRPAGSRGRCSSRCGHRGRADAGQGRLLVSLLLPLLVAALTAM